MRFLTFVSAAVFLCSGSLALGQKSGGEPVKSQPTVSTAVDAPHGPGVTITAPIATHPEGSVIDALFMISGVNGLGIISYQMDIHYDHSVITFNSCLTTGTISSTGQITCNGTVPGLVKLVWTNTVPLANGPSGLPNRLFKLNFNVVGTNGQFSPLTFSAVQVMEFAVPANTIAGQITIGDTTAAETTVTGRVMNQAGQPISGVRIVLTDASGNTKTALSNPFGYYRFMDIRAGDTYVVNATAKRYTFASQVLPVGEEVTNFVLISDQ